MRIKELFDDFKIAMVYVGTIIGAGFATGREIALYFGGYGFFTALLGGLFCGLLCFLFMIVGKKGIKYIGERTGRVLTIGASIITLAAMSSAVSELLGAKVPLSGVILCFICLLFVGKDMKNLKNINTIIITFVIAMLVYLAIRKGEISFTGRISVFRGLSYACMNILLTSELAVEYGKNRSIKSITRIAIITSIALSALILLIFSVINNGYMDAPMPVYAVAESIGLAPVALAVIVGAIFTTMLSAVTLLERDMKKLITVKTGRFTIVVGISAVACFLPFAFIVNNFYHLISIGGAVASLLALIALLIDKTKSKCVLKIEKIHNKISKYKKIKTHTLSK